MESLTNSMSEVGLESLNTTEVNEDNTAEVNEEEQVLYQPGAVILSREEPYAKVLNNLSKGKRCDNCFKEGINLQRCPGCKRMFYCDAQCQQKDWEYAHYVECGTTYFNNPEDAGMDPIFDFDTYFMRQMSRLHAIFQLQKDPSYTMYDETTRSCKDLVSHYSNGLTPESYYMNHMHIISKKKLLEPNLDKPYGNTYALPNAVEILDETNNKAIGTAIYIQGSYFDHSCRPTATMNLSGIFAEVRAIAPIKKGERPYVSYLTGHKPRSERIKYLKDRYYFECQCSLCTEEEANGDSISYSELEGLQRYTPLENVPWTFVVDTREREIKLMRKCYVKYDKRITHKVFALFQEVASRRRNLPKLNMKELAKEAEEHLRITFGPDCRDLITWRSRCNRCLLDFDSKGNLVN